MSGVGPIYTHSDWWGSDTAVVRASLPAKVRSGRDVRESDKVAGAVAEARGKLPGSPVRFGSVSDASLTLRVRPLLDNPGYSVNVALLDWATRAADPARWELVDVNGNLCLVGVDAGGEPVALIAARRPT